MAKFPVDIEYNQTSKGSGARDTVNSLKAIEDQANRTREKMAKLTEVGSKTALLGGAIIGPALLAMNKYVSTVKDAEPVSRRITELGKKWEESQVRLGRVTAKIVLPALEKGAQILDNIVKFAEKYPGVVQAALTIGTTLVVLGGIITTTAQLVSAVATLQGLAAAAGGAALGGGGIAGAAAGAGGGLAAAVASGVTFAIPAIVGALALAIGAPIGLGIGNALAGTNQTWSDIAETGRKLWEITKFFYGSYLPKLIGQGLQNIGAIIGNAIKSVIDAIGSWFRGGQASGGYANQAGFYARAEKGREFVLNAGTTSAAERAIGGRLNQTSAAQYMTNNLQIGSGMTIAQTRRIVKANNRALMEGILGL